MPLKTISKLALASTMPLSWTNYAASQPSSDITPTRKPQSLRHAHLPTAPSEQFLMNRSLSFAPSNSSALTIAYWTKDGYLT